MTKETEQKLPGLYDNLEVASTISEIIGVPRSAILPTQVELCFEEHYTTAITEIKQRYLKQQLL
jgi:hypothetical protein